MQKIMILAMVFGILSIAIRAEEGYLSFIPKISIGKDVNKNPIDGNFKGINADILYGLTKNVEIGANISWTPYDTDYDDDLNVFGLTGVLKYNFNDINGFKPYMSARGGLGFGIGDNLTRVEVDKGAEVEIEIRGQRIAAIVAIAAGLEYNNFNLELSYQITEFEKSKSIFLEDNSKEKLVSLSLGYRFE